ncbi:MAG: hypothetical protein LUH05_04640 [Candidatus Gastranaerophilales bacterium]|nr:hypothetical protein [Candidatus Gastranaerophilales bacterium]
MSNEVGNDWLSKLITIPGVTFPASGSGTEALEQDEQSLFAQISNLEQTQSYEDMENSFLEVSSARVEQLNGEKTAIMQDMTAQQETVNDLSSSISEQNQTISTISQSLSSLTAPNQSDYAVTETDEDGNTTTTYPGYDDALAEYNAQLAELQNQLSAAEEQLEQLSSDLETAQRTIEDLSDSLNAVTQELQDLSSEEGNEEVNDENQEEDESEAQLAELQEQLDSVQAELAEAKAAEAVAKEEIEQKQNGEECLTDPIGFTVGEGDDEVTYEFFIDEDGDGELSSTSEFLGADNGISELTKLAGVDGEISQAELEAAGVQVVKRDADGNIEVMSIEDALKDAGYDTTGDISITIDDNIDENDTDGQEFDIEAGTDTINAHSTYEKGKNLADEYGIDYTLTDEVDENSIEKDDTVDDGELVYHGSSDSEGAYTYETEDKDGNTTSYEVSVDKDGKYIVGDEIETSSSASGLYTDDTRIETGENGAYVEVEAWAGDEGENSSLYGIIENSYDFDAIEQAYTSAGKEYNYTEVRDTLLNAIVNNSDNNITDPNLIYTGATITLADPYETLDLKKPETTGDVSDGSTVSDDENSEEEKPDLSEDDVKKLSNALFYGTEEDDKDADEIWQETDFSQYSDETIADIATEYNKIAEEKGEDTNFISKAESTTNDEQFNTIVNSLVSQSEEEETDGEVTDMLIKSINNELEKGETTLLDSVINSENTTALQNLINNYEISKGESLAAAISNVGIETNSEGEDYAEKISGILDYVEISEENLALIQTLTGDDETAAEEAWSEIISMSDEELSEFAKAYDSENGSGSFIEAVNGKNSIYNQIRAAVKNVEANEDADMNTPIITSTAIEDLTTIEEQEEQLTIGDIIDTLKDSNTDWNEYFTSLNLTSQQIADVAKVYNDNITAPQNNFVKQLENSYEGYKGENEYTELLDRVYNSEGEVPNQSYKDTLDTIERYIDDIVKNGDSDALEEEIKNNIISIFDTDDETGNYIYTPQAIIEFLNEVNEYTNNTYDEDNSPNYVKDALEFSSSTIRAIVQNMATDEYSTTDIIDFMNSLTELTGVEYSEELSQKEKLSLYENASTEGSEAIKELNDKISAADLAGNIIENHFDDEEEKTRLKELMSYVCCNYDLSGDNDYGVNDDVTDLRKQDIYEESDSDKKKLQKILDSDLSTNQKLYLIDQIFDSTDALVDTCENMLWPGNKQKYLKELISLYGG